jgi:hypothetical protein
MTSLISRQVRHACSLVFIMGGIARADVLIGTGTGGNRYPFGDPCCGPGTIYQQIYASSNFSSPLNITGIDFFTALPGGVLRSGTYTFFLSTTSVPVNGITTSFDANRGSDNSLFGTYVFGSAHFVPDVLEFTGASFLYDPALGNLLLDIRISGGGVGQPIGSDGFFRANNGDAGGVYSRVYDFEPPSGFFINWGLQTRFISVTTTPEPDTIGLMATGLVILWLCLRRRDGWLRGRR